MRIDNDPLRRGRRPLTPFGIFHTIQPETRFNVPRGAIFGYHRAKFEEAPGECRLKAFWSRNDKGVEELRRTLPDLKTDKGEHYADILAALYQRRIEDSAKRE